MQIVHPDLSTPIYETVKKMILTQELSPGQKIIQEKLAHELGVSRTPLRQALQRLEYEYLVQSIPRRGMFVKKISPREIIDVFYCREGIETVAARLAAQLRNEKELTDLEAVFSPFLLTTEIDPDEYARQDDNFHRMLVQFSQNKALEKVYIQGNIHSRVSQIGLLRTPEETLPEHLAILEAIKEKNSRKAENEVRKHIQRSRERAEKALNNLTT